jgi:hypothetical protein
MIPRCSFSEKKGRSKAQCQYRKGHEGPHATHFGQHVDIRYIGPIGRPGNVYIVRTSTRKTPAIAHSTHASIDSIPCDFPTATALAKDMAHRLLLNVSVIYLPILGPQPTIRR